MKMELSEDMCNSLIKWLQTLDLSKTVQNINELSDGVLMAHALVQIAPNHFIRLNSSIHDDIGSNWRLKINNLRKIVNCLSEYYQDVLNLHLLDTAKPDLTNLNETDSRTQIGKILCLILGCAVNCDEKQEYITRIMELEESVQRNIMQAIQYLEEVTHGRGRSSLSLLGLESDAKLQRLITELETATDIKELLSQRCHNLETQVTCLTEEKCSLTQENNKLMKKLKDFESVFSKEEPDGIISRSTEMRKQIESLKDDLFRTETQRDDYRAKTLEQEKDTKILQEKILELQTVAENAAQLKDEMDALRETADKAKMLEATVLSYKTKLEEYADLKKKYKTLEDENNEYYQQNLKYEEEIKRNNLFKLHSEQYKKQAADLHQKIEEELQKSDKLSFENKKLESKLLMIQRERESLVDERNGLKEMNEELRCQQQRQNVGQTAVASELAPTELQKRIKQLEQDNQSLRLNAEEVIAKQSHLEDIQQRLEKVLEQNRTANQRILELEGFLEDEVKGVNATAAAAATTTSTVTINDELIMYKNKCLELQDALTNKENELQNSIGRYNKSLEKARDIIKAMDQESSSNKLTTSHSVDEAQMPKHTTTGMTEQEERLLTTCFYKLSTVCQREAVDERFALLTQGQSFLSRQRQAMPRKSMQPYRSK